MAGVLLHLAMGDPQKTDPDNTAYNASFKKAYTLGLLLPDIAKRGFVGSKEDFDRFFQGCSPDDIPTYEEIQAFRKNHHFNPNRQNPAQQDTRNPNLNMENIRKCVDYFRRLRVDAITGGWSPEVVWADGA